jgi:outer membrane protein assembly factor BamE (lipoprotein component of BamABCDE complex)
MCCPSPAPRLSLALALVFVALAGGCVSVFTQETMQKAGEEGVFVTDVELAEVREGMTTHDDLLERFGPPARVERPEPDVERLVYVYWVRRSEERTVVPIRRSVRVTHAVLTVSYDLRDGVVVAIERQSAAASETPSAAE